VITWVDNFLGFDVGEIVPVGYYDRDRGVWVPADNGVVVSLLDENGDGGVDAVDKDGDGIADDLDGDGSFSDEVTGLSDPGRYLPGSTFWRVLVTHFTPWDLNWPYGWPSDPVAPNSEEEPFYDGEICPDGDCDIIHKDIPIPGTDITLHYASTRVEGYHAKITVPASGEWIPSSLKRIIVRVNVAGRSFEEILDPLPNQAAQFVWDGLDHLGRSVRGTAVAHVRVGFVYDMVYWRAGGFARAFAQAGSETTMIWARREWISWRGGQLAVHRMPRGFGMAEGWTISVHHHLSPRDPSTLYKGDGTIIRESYAALIDTVAGNGEMGYSGDGGPAVEAGLYRPWAVAVDAAGNLYIADTFNNRIRKVDTSGIITTVAGGGSPPDGLGDGGPATEAGLSRPGGVAVDAAGNVYIADTWHSRIRKVDTNGIITTVAGGGSPPDGLGDGGYATEARLLRPYNVAADMVGNLYIADTYNYRIRKVDPGGIITTRQELDRLATAAMVALPPGLGSTPQLV
jgi:hypothetical protein